MDTNEWMSRDSYRLSEFIIELHSSFLRTSWADKLSHQCRRKKKDNDKLPWWIKAKTLSLPKYQQLYIIHVWEGKIIIAHIEMSVYDDKASS